MSCLHNVQTEYTGSELFTRHTDLSTQGVSCLHDVQTEYIGSVLFTRRTD